MMLILAWWRLLAVWLLVLLLRLAVGGTAWLLLAITILLARGLTLVGLGLVLGRGAVGWGARWAGRIGARVGGWSAGVGWLAVSLGRRMRRSRG